MSMWLQILNEDGEVIFQRGIKSNDLANPDNALELVSEMLTEVAHNEIENDAG